MLGLLIRSTKENHLVETGEQDAVKPLLSDAPDTGNGRKGIIIGLIAVFAAIPLVHSLTTSSGPDPVHSQIKEHQAITSATSGFTKETNADVLRAALVQAGVPSALAKAPDLSDAHLKLVGGMPAPGDRSGGAFRYKDHDNLWTLQAITHLPGGGEADESRHAGHAILRGYQNKGTSSVVWQDAGVYYVFTGPGDVGDVLDRTQSAIFGTTPKAGGAHH
jgi:hypothetical protein